jgi:hypothetical protein
MYLYQRKNLKQKQKEKYFFAEGLVGPSAKNRVPSEAVGTGFCVPTARLGSRQRRVNWVFNAVNRGRAFDEGTLCRRPP